MPRIINVGEEMQLVQARKEISLMKKGRIFHETIRIRPTQPQYFSGNGDLLLDVCKIIKHIQQQRFQAPKHPCTWKTNHTFKNILD